MNDTALGVLLVALALAAELAAVVAIGRHLIRTELEGIQGQLRTIEAQVAESTVTLTITEPGKRLATLSTSEAAAVTGLPHTTIKAMVKDGRLPTSPHSDPTRPRIPANAIRRIADGQ